MANQPQMPPTGNVKFPFFLVAQPPGVTLTIPVVQPITPGIQPITPKVQPITPGIQPIIPGIQPIIPVIQPIIPGVQPITPGIQPITPKVQPITPGIQTIIPLTQLIIPGVQPRVQPIIPVIQPIIPRVQPITPGIQPIIPRVQPITPGIQPIIPRVQPITPGIQPITPGIQPIIPRVQPSPKIQPTIQPMIPPTIQPTVRPASPVVRPASPIVRATSPVVQPNDNYYPQDDPRPEEFKFRATPENSTFIQASIQTARQLFPSLETHIQVAEIANVLPDLRRRSQFPSYMRDASPFEIYKIYQDEVSDNAKIFLNAFNELSRDTHDLDTISQEERNLIEKLLNQGLGKYNIRQQVKNTILGENWWALPDIDYTKEHQLNVELPYHIDMISKDNDMKEIYGNDYRQSSSIISREMRNRGYKYQYIGFIRNDIPAGQARDDTYPLTPENFLATLTPDQEILMEEWRKGALKGGTTTIHNLDLLGLRPITEEYNIIPGEYRPGYTNKYHPPILQTIGFSKDRLRAAVSSVANRLNPNRKQRRRAGRTRFRPDLPITRNYIMNEGEKAESVYKDKIYDISNQGLTMGSGMTKAYYMMLYNELRVRGLLTNTQF